MKTGMRFQVRQHTYIQLWILCLSLLMRVAVPVWAADAGLAAQDGLSYKVIATNRQRSPTWGLLTVRRARVILSESVNGADIEMPCSDFMGGTTTEGRIKLMKRTGGRTKSANAHGLKYQSISIVVKQEGVDFGFVDPSTVLRQIKDACATQQAEEPRRAQLDREELARQREEAARRIEAETREQKLAAAKRLADQQAAATKRAADFRDGILTASRAAEEPDPFASIRGDFDLSAPDSRQWKTSMQLPDAEKCALLKTAAPTPTAASAWTFGCLFHASGDGYERMVKSVQSILNLPYLPDEKAVNINQVFFADASKAASRLFVAKVNAATVGISIVAVRVAGAAPNPVSPDAFDEGAHHAAHRAEHPGGRCKGSRGPNSTCASRCGMRSIPKRGERS